jgi:cytochrome P450
VTDTVARQVKGPDAPIAFDPSDRAFVRDPYPRYAELREAPVLHPSDEGLWVLTRYDDVSAVLRDTRLSSDPRHAEGARRERRAQRMPLGDTPPPVMLFLDPPDHTRLRRLANKAFTPRAVEAIRPRIVEIVDELLDRAAEQGEMDVMADLAFPLPVIVICELLGVATGDQEQFKEWSTDVARVLDPVADPAVAERAMPAVFNFIQYFSTLIEERRAAPRDDLLSALIQAEEDGTQLTTPELFAMCILLFVAGHETTTNLIGNGTLALLRHRDQLDALGTDPALAAAATEELLRYDAPVQATARTATIDLEVNGLELRKGEGVVCSLAAANRDPRAFDEPDRLVLARGRANHLAFGSGIHFCLGAPLARVEGQAAFTALAQRFPGAELRVDDPPYRDHFVLRGLESLPVSLT